MKRSTQQKLLRRKRRILSRLRHRGRRGRDRPALTAHNIHYEVADRIVASDCGGIGVIHQLARQSGLVDALDRDLQLLQVHRPYHESDHVLHIAYSLMTGGTCLQDLELRRQDEAYLDALGARRLPDPTTAGDFCRRFAEADVQQLMDSINQVRLRIWKQQPPGFFEQAVIYVDGTIALTSGEHKEGIGYSYNGQWGYHPLVVSLGNDREVLFVANRPGNRPSHEDAAGYLDRSIALCRQGGFRRLRLGGDTDFSQTEHLDRWDADAVEFVFGIDAMANLVEQAEALAAENWAELPHRPHEPLKTAPRAKRPNVKEEIVRQKCYTNLRPLAEHVAEFSYRPTLCAKAYRVVVLRKKVAVEKGGVFLEEQTRYFFFITNLRTQTAGQIVHLARQRCDQENLIEQLKNGVKAMKMPLHDLVSNWAYMAMASLAWTLKAWLGLILPEGQGRWAQRQKRQKQDLLGMEFKGFINALMRLPCQIVRQGRKIVYRLLSWNPWQEVLLRAMAALVRPLRC